jgi:hypothetical protein
MIFTKKNLIKEFIDDNGEIVDGDENFDNTSQINVGSQTTDGYISQARQRMEYPFNFGGTAYSRGATLQGTELGDYTGTGVNDGKGIDIEDVGNHELFTDDVYQALSDDTEEPEFSEFEDTENVDGTEVLEPEMEEEPNLEMGHLRELIQQRVDKALANDPEFKVKTATDLENTRPYGSKLVKKETISQKFADIDDLVHEYYERKNNKRR